MKNHHLHIYYSAHSSPMLCMGVVGAAVAIVHFHTFCSKVYYISNFKDFNNSAPDC